MRCVVTLRDGSHSHTVSDRLNEAFDPFSVQAECRTSPTRARNTRTTKHSTRNHCTPAVQTSTRKRVVPKCCKWCSSRGYRDGRGSLFAVCASVFPHWVRTSSSPILSRKQFLHRFGFILRLKGVRTVHGQSFFLDKPHFYHGDTTDSGRQRKVWCAHMLHCGFLWCFHFGLGDVWW